MGGTGYPCFRRDALPVVLLFTDAPMHNGPSGRHRYGGALSPPAHSYEATIRELNRLGLRVIGFDSGGGNGRADLEAVARVTNAVANRSLPDLSGRELAVLLPLVVMIFVMGIFPNLFLGSMHQSVRGLLAQVEAPAPLVHSPRPARTRRRRAPTPGRARGHQPRPAGPVQRVTPKLLRDLSRRFQLHPRLAPPGAPATRGGRR